MCGRGPAKPASALNSPTRKSLTPRPLRALKTIMAPGNGTIVPSPGARTSASRSTTVMDSSPYRAVEAGSSRRPMGPLRVPGQIPALPHAAPDVSPGVDRAAALLAELSFRPCPIAGIESQGPLSGEHSEHHPADTDSDPFEELPAIRRASPPFCKCIKPLIVHL